MAHLYLAAFFGKAKGTPVLQEEVEFTKRGGSVQSSVLPKHDQRLSYHVRVFADANCFITWGKNPVAGQPGSVGVPIQEKTAEYFVVDQGNRFAVTHRKK